MPILPDRRYTLEEYFALELSSDEKYEYFDGEVFSMAGASLAHEQIVANVIVSLRNSLRGRPCRVLPSNARVKVPSLPPYRYPDIKRYAKRRAVSRLAVSMCWRIRL
ncbi:MAG: hypothetical protein DMG14_09585 [Acidobacteria bacterium]|nr:MAG: hypothetical protein DMG14_09585 [Acidobacteriota bacterium]